MRAGRVPAPTAAARPPGRRVRRPKRCRVLASSSRGHRRSLGDTPLQEQLEEVPGGATEPGVEQFNTELARKGLPPVKIGPSSEVLADEDILEMVNAGPAGTSLAFDYIAEFWKQVVPNLVVDKGAAVRTEGQVAWMTRAPGLQAGGSPYPCPLAVSSSSPSHAAKRCGPGRRRISWPARRSCGRRTSPPSCR